MSEPQLVALKDHRTLNRSLDNRTLQFLAGKLLSRHFVLLEDWG